MGKSGNASEVNRRGEGERGTGPGQRRGRGQGGSGSSWILACSCIGARERVPRERRTAKYNAKLRVS